MSTPVNSGNGDVGFASGTQFATDDVGGVKYPISKLDIGVAGASVPVSAASPLPVSGPLTNTELRAAAVPISDGGGSVTVDGSVSVTNFPATQPISAASLPLPTGAATEAGNLATIAAKDFATQTTLALIKAKTDNIDVLLSSRTKPADSQHVTVDNASVAVTGPLTDTQLRASAVPVSGTVTANIGTAGTLALDATLTGGSQKSIVRGAAKGTTTAADVTSNPIDANTQALHVDGSKVTQPISAASLPLPTGASQDSTLTGGTAKAIMRGGAKGATVAADVTSTAEGADHQAVDVQIYSGGVAKDPTAIRALTNADVVTGEISKWIGSAAPTVGQKTMANSLPVVLASDQSSHPVNGDVAAASADSGNPVKVGGIAKSGLPTILADGNRSNLLTDLYGRPRIIIERPKLLGAYKAESGRLAVLAAAHAATAGFCWLINPVASGVVLYLKKIMAMALPVAVTAFASTPRITIERTTFTGTASGATITAAKRDSNDAANVCTLRTASTGLTLTAGAVICSFMVPPVLTAVGVAVPAEQYLYDSTDEDDYIILRAGEGIIARQADAGTTSDTRIAVITYSWEER